MQKADFLQLFGSLAHIGQNPNEMWEVVRVLQELDAKSMIEIGVSRGGSMRIWSEVLGPGGFIVGIDNEDRITSTNQPIFWDFSTAEPEINYVVGDSHSPELITSAASLLGGRKVDFLWIDGDHSYEGCKADYDNFSPFVRPGGVIGIHDCDIIPEVRKFVDSLAVNRKIVDKAPTGQFRSLGTALLFKP